MIHRRIHKDSIFKHQEREGFTPVCQYASIKPEPNEIGGIVRFVGPYIYEDGLYTFDGEYIERIFLCEDDKESESIITIDPNSQDSD